MRGGEGCLVVYMGAGGVFGSVLEYIYLSATFLSFISQRKNRQLLIYQKARKLSNFLLDHT